MSSPGAGGHTSSVDFGSKGDFRPPAPKNARLEIVVEGKTFVCRDGTIIGSESGVATELFKLFPGLMARTLLLRLEEVVLVLLPPLVMDISMVFGGVAFLRCVRSCLVKVDYVAG